MFLDYPMQALFLITDGGHLRKRAALVGAIEAAIEGAGGAVGHVLLREQHPEAAKLAGVSPASDDAVLELANALLPICRNASAKLIINRRIDLARTSGCDGVHLGKDGPKIAEARLALGAGATIGYSAHSPEELTGMSQADLGYALLSPIFNPLSKRSSFAPLGVKTLARAASLTSIPLFALGGVTRENARSCIEAGAAGIAMISSVLLSVDPGGQARALAEICYAAREQSSSIRNVG